MIAKAYKARRRTSSPQTFMRVEYIHILLLTACLVNICIYVRWRPAEAAIQKEFWIYTTLATLKQAGSLYIRKI